MEKPTQSTNGHKPKLVEYKPRQREELLPTCPESEEAVIGAILLASREVLPTIAPLITPQDFHDDELRWIYEAALTLDSSSAPADYVTVTQALRDNGRLVEMRNQMVDTTLINRVPTIYSAEHYAKIVAETATRRRLILSASHISNAAYEEADLNTALVKARAALDQAATAARPKPEEADLRDRWLSIHPDTVYSAGAWWRYDGQGIWRKVEEAVVESELQDVIDAARSEGIKPTGRLLGSVAKITRARIVKPSTIWDSNPAILVTAKGVVNLYSGEFRDHAPADYATAGVPYDYDPDADCPVWRYFLNSLPADLVPFLQEWAGYCLSTDTSHETAVWLYGEPGSGKSTYITGLQAVLGPRAGNLSLRDIERSRFALSRLPGKTLVVATEAPDSYMTTSDILNALISGEPVEVEAKHKDAYTFEPRAKITWAMNVLPRVGNVADGLFRRVKVVKFPVIPVEQRDPDVKEAIKTEGAGVLLWAMDGLRRLRARGRFAIPESVVRDTAEFQETNDIPALFVAEKCKVDPTYRVQSDHIYRAYSDWCYSTNHKPVSSTRFAGELQRLGFTRDRINGRTIYFGVGLLAHETTPEPPTTVEV